MNTETLKRQSLDASHQSQTTPDFRKELALKAASMLKYSKMNEDLANEQYSDAFLQVLREKDIRPFTDESVEEYKQAAIQDVDKHKVNRYLYHNPLALILALALVAAFIFLMSWVWTVYIAQLATLVTMGCLPILGLAGWLAYRSDCPDEPLEYAWEEDKLASYKLPIPEFVLETAVFIKTKFPSAEFSICTLREKERESFAFDPFLVCRYAGREYHLEVWNEPGYKQVREV